MKIGSNHKILDLSILKAFADDRCNSNCVLCFGKGRKYCGKGNKRVMVALDRSPESISPQNKFYLIFWSIEQ